MKTALITGVTGQDGSYLAELLLSKIIKLLESKEELLLSRQKEWIIFIIMIILF